MYESMELFCDVAILFVAVLFVILYFVLVLYWAINLYKEEIEWVLSRIPAVQRYRERRFWESLKRGELSFRLSRTDPETGQVIERFVAIPASPNFDPYSDDVESQSVEPEIAAPENQTPAAGNEVPHVPAPPA
jgi:hypothetical protein